MTTHERYHDRKRKEASVRWLAMLANRRAGMKLREIAALYGVNTSIVARCINKAESLKWK
jgi:transposase